MTTTPCPNVVRDLLSLARALRFAVVVVTVAGGCVPVFPPAPAPLFTLPLSIEGTDVGSVIVDTGGSYELMLRDDFGLTVLGSVEVLAFGGKEHVSITEGFSYSVGGFDSIAETALVGLSACDCNGLGFKFFRETGVILALDFTSLEASLLFDSLESGIILAFQPPPPELPNFDSAFIDVEVTSGDVSLDLLGLLDTGTNSTVLRRGLFENPSRLTPSLLQVTVGQPDLGKVAVSAMLFDTEGLPDIILGTDVMRAWGDRWYFSFEESGGVVSVIPAGADAEDGPDTAANLSAVAMRVAAGVPAGRRAQYHLPGNTACEDAPAEKTSETDTTFSETALVQ